MSLSNLFPNSVASRRAACWLPPLLLLAACGGAEDPTLPVAQAGREQAQAVPVRVPDAATLFAWAPTAYPQFFAGTPSAGSDLGYTYRYFPDSKTFLGVSGQQVAVFGPPFGDAVVDQLGAHDVVGATDGIGSDALQLLGKPTGALALHFRGERRLGCRVALNAQTDEPLGHCARSTVTVISAPATPPRGGIGVSAPVYALATRMPDTPRSRWVTRWTTRRYIASVRPSRW